MPSPFAELCTADKISIYENRPLFVWMLTMLRNTYDGTPWRCSKLSSAHLRQNVIFSVRSQEGFKEDSVRQFGFIRDQKNPQERITTLRVHLLAEVFTKIMNVSVTSLEESSSPFEFIRAEYWNSLCC